MSFFLFFVVLRNILFCGDVRDCLRLLTDLSLDMPVTVTYRYLQYSTWTVYSAIGQLSTFLSRRSLEAKKK